MQTSAEQAKEALNTACGLISEENHGRAFAHFLLALTLDPSLKDEESLEDMFVDCLKSWGAQLVSMERGQDAVWCYEQACDAWTESSMVLHATGQFLFSFGYHKEGTSFLQRAVRMKPHLPDWCWDLQNASSSLVERWHFRMLNDRRRNQCYFESLKKAVRSGHRKILDIGSGTGLLSMLAVKAGAQRVTAVEMDETMYNLSNDIIEHNWMKEHIDVMKMTSTEMQSLAASNRYTLVVTETADAGLLGEGIIPTLQHAWKYLLKRNESDQDKGDSADSTISKVIPSGASVYIQLIQSDFIRRQHRVYRKEILPLLDETEIISKSVNMTFEPSSAADGGTEPYSSENLSRIPGVWKPLTTPHQVYSFNFNNPEILSTDQLTESMIELPVICPGRPDAIISWFDLHLDDDVTVSSAPEAGTCWEHAVYPIHPSHIDQGQNGNNTNSSVNLGDSVKISCRCHPTWMSFQLTEVKRKPQTVSNMMHLDVNTKNLFKDSNQVLRLPSKDIATLNDERYCSWLEKSIRNNLTEKLKDRLGEVCRDGEADLKEDTLLSINRTSKDAFSETISCIGCKSQGDSCKSEEVMKRHQETGSNTLNERSPSREVSTKVCPANEGGEKTRGYLEGDHYQECGSDCLKRESRNLDGNASAMMETLEPDRERRVTILDLSEINLSYFTSSSLDLLKTEVIGLTPNTDGMTLLDKIVSSKKRTKERFRTYTSECDNSGNHVRLIISDLVESGGVLRKNALEDVYFAALKSSSQRDVKVIPEVLTIHAVCIESEELSKNAKISGRDSTLGIAVNLMNTFKTSTQLYVCLSKLTHKELTDKFKVFTLDMTRLVKNETPMEVFTQSMELTLEAKDSGKLSAILYWFEMTCGNSTLSTMDEETHWMQAAFIMDEDVIIQRGKKVRIKAYFRNNAMSFSIEESKSR